MSNLKENCKQTKDLINESINWIQENIDSDEARPILSNLKDLRADARNLETFSDGRATLAVYGESQIGKSYFMSELLKNKQENRFYLKFKAPQSRYDNFFQGEYLDFLARVNPDGGKESSGIVTRFTITQDDQKPEAQIPVKFLRQVDLAMILTDTYALDIKNTDTLNDYEYSAIVDILKELSSSKSTNEIDGMDESDVVDFKNYLNKYLKDGFSTIHFFNKNKIWDDIIALLPRIPYNQRYKVFELFWGRVSVFTEVFNKLSEVLNTINFAKEGNVELDAILPKETNSKKSSIIDVGTLADFYSIEKLPTINIHTSHGIAPNTGIGEATAIIKEMTLTVDGRILEEDSRKFLNDVDVYDFPGARTRKEYDVARISSLDSIHDSEDGSEDNILHECITRGKVNFLFNYYSDMNDVTTLIFGQKNSNQNVNTLPRQIDNWIMNTHGATAEERSSKEPSLFIAFHFFNIELNGKPSDLEDDIEQYSGLWTNRLEVNSEQFIGKQIRTEDNWIEQWTPNKKFQNFLFLRDPDPAFNSATRIDNNGNEIYNPGYELKHQDMKQSFLNTPAVKKYIKNPNELWENSASLNNTGTEYIVNNISPVTTLQRREDQILTRLHKTLKNSIIKVIPFYKSGNYDEELQKVQQKTNASLKAMIVAMKTKNSFGNILYNLELPEDLAWKTLYDVQNPIFDHTVGEDGSIKSNSVLDMNDNSNMIDIDIDEFGLDLGLDFDEIENSSDTETDEIDIHAKNKTKAEMFVDKLLANWIEYTEEKFNDNELVKLGISKDTANWISLNLKESFSRVDFKEFISSKINTEIERYIQNPDSIFLVSRLSRNYFNDFINSYGWNHTPIDQRPFMKDGAILFAHEEKNGEVSHMVKLLEHDDIKLDNDFPGKDRFNHWLKGFQEASKMNLEYKYSDGGIVSNPEANTKLGSIIESFNKIS